MRAKAAEESELSHRSVSKGCVLKYTFHLLNSARVINVFIAASFDDDRSRTISNYSFRLPSRYKDINLWIAGLETYLV